VKKPSFQMFLIFFANLVPRVLRLLGQRVVAERDSGIMELILRLTILKLGSHMPSTNLRHSRRYCLGYFSDMRKEVASKRDHPSLYRRHACEVDSNSTSQAYRR